MSIPIETRPVYPARAIAEEGQDPPGCPDVGAKATLISYCRRVETIAFLDLTLRYISEPMRIASLSDLAPMA